MDLDHGGIIGMAKQVAVARIEHVGAGASGTSYCDGINFYALSFGSLCKNILFGLLIQFESFDLAGNGLKRFLLWLSTIGHHSRMWKFGPEGSEGAQYGRKCLKSDLLDY